MTAASILSPEQAAQRLLDEVEPPARLLVAVSGGSDSTGLLVALSAFNPANTGLSLVAATIDHALRSRSAEEAREVGALCARLGIAHVIRRWEGEKPQSGIAAAAREARYRLLMDIADEVGADAILTGHTCDDQAETLAMRAARRDDGFGPGLAGMAEAVLLDRRRWLIRPFLNTRRADIRAFLMERGEGWIDDPSNLDPHYERVRVRISRNGFSDAEAVKGLARAEERTLLSDRAAALIRNHAAMRQGVLVHLAAPALEGEAEALRYALSLLAAVIGGRAHAPASDSMDRVMAFIGGGHPGRMTAARTIFDRRRGGLYMMRENRGMAPLHVAPGEIAIWDGRYRIANRCDDEVVIGPTVPDRDEALALFPGAPPAIAMRAMAAMPFVAADDTKVPLWPAGHLPHKGGEYARQRLSSDETNAFGGKAPPPCGEGLGRGYSGEGLRSGYSSEPQIHLHPILAPFDRFLPQFDLSLATEIAVLVGCNSFPPLPVKDLRRKR